MTNDELASLGYLPDLEVVRLQDTNVSDAGLVHLKMLPNLCRLSLNGTRVSDEGMRHLAGRQVLEMLSLNGTDVSDTSAQHIVKLNKLRALVVGDTRLTESGLRQLESALPGCVVRPNAAEKRRQPHLSRRATIRSRSSVAELSLKRRSNSIAATITGAIAGTVSERTIEYGIELTIDTWQGLPAAGVSVSRLRLEAPATGQNPT